MAVSVERLITSDILKSARYLGNERLAVNKPWDSAAIRWVLTYPELYEVGASNLGHIILYNILNAQPRQLCDRAYLPRKDLGVKLRATHTLLFAVESKRWLIEFDILGFSLSEELLPEIGLVLAGGVKTAWEQGGDKIKLYFMIGLPGKTDDDVLDIAEKVRSLKRECWAQGRKSLSFDLTISNFTPKPHTPFQWHSVSTTEFKRKQNLLKQEFRQMRSVKVNFTDVRISAIDKKWLQADLNRILFQVAIPDCFFAGCSHCGVCGTDFGHKYSHRTASKAILRPEQVAVPYSV